MDGDAGGSLPRQFGEYQIHSELGRGGMGVIYQARHARLNRWVALKVMAGGEFASRDFQQRFRTEAEAAAALEHPNIVPIYEVGEVDGLAYFSMKLVAGGTLTQAPVRDARAAVEAVITVARAVQYAHERGILHRDLKPNNVLVDSSGGLFLTDFGLAKLLERDSSLTGTLAVLGTPSYMAPEQARGDTRHITTAADVYGLGAILYELIAGRPPFTGQSSIEVIRQVVEQEPVPPSRSRNSDLRTASRQQLAAPSDQELLIRPSKIENPIDRDLDVICLKCLEKDPARRYASAGALADDLQRWLNHEPIRARPATATERVRKWVRRRPAWAALIVTVVVSLLALGVGSALFTLKVVQARRAAEAANRQLSRNLFYHEWQEAEGLVALEKTSGALMWFARALRQQPRDEGLATRLLSLLSAHAFPLPRGQPITNDAPLRTVGLSPDDTWVVTADAAGRVRCWSVAGGRQLFALPRIFQQPGAVFLPGQSAILVVDRAGLTLWPAAGGAEPLRELPVQDLSAFDVSADGRRLALGWRNGRAEVWDTATWQRISLCTPGDGGNPNFLRLSRDGTRLLRSRQSELRVFECDTGRLCWRAQPPLPGGDWGYAKGDWSADGRRIVSLHTGGGGAGRFAVWEFPGIAAGEPPSAPTPLLLAPLRFESAGIPLGGDGARSFVWTRSGYVDFHSTDTGAAVMEPLEFPGAVAGVAAASTGEWIATASDRLVQFWDLAMRLPAPRIVTNATAIADVHFGPDGSWLACADADEVRLINADDGQPRLELATGGPVRDLVLSADGRRVAASITSGGRHDVGHRNRRGRVPTGTGAVGEPVGTLPQWPPLRRRGERTRLRARVRRGDGPRSGAAVDQSCARGPLALPSRWPATGRADHVRDSGALGFARPVRARGGRGTSAGQPPVGRHPPRRGRVVGAIQRRRSPPAYRVQRPHCTALGRGFGQNAPRVPPPQAGLCGPLFPRRTACSHRQRRSHRAALGRGARPATGRADDASRRRLVRRFQPRWPVRVDGG